MAQSKPSPVVTLPFLILSDIVRSPDVDPSYLTWKYIYCPPDLSFSARITLALHHHLDRAFWSVTKLSQAKCKPINAVLDSFSSSQDPRRYQQALLSLPTIKLYHRMLSAEPTQHLEHHLSRKNSKGHLEAESVILTVFRNSQLCDLPATRVSCGPRGDGKQKTFRYYVWKSKNCWN